MLFVLAGPSYVGKKTALSHFMKLYSFSSIIPYTTKPVERRYGEVEGIKYHYVANKDRTDIKNDDYIWDMPFQCNEQQDEVLYAYKKADIKNAIDSYANFIIHASVGNAIKIYDEYHKKNKNHLYVLFLNFRSSLTQDFFREKYVGMVNIIRDGIIQDQQAEDAEFKRRFNHAQKEQNAFLQNRKKFDKCVKADHKYEMCEELEKEILPKLVVMPTSPDRIPGALSDVDIIYMSENRKNDILEISVNGKILRGEDLRSILCGCGIQLTLSSTIRTLKKNILYNYVDMANSETNLEAQLAKLYPEQNISIGYILKPNETILCTSDEVITVPHDVYAIVSSKFSYTQLGLAIEFGTSIIQAGHCGRVHFQIKNNTENSICIYPHIQVVQLLFFRTVQPSSQKYHEDTKNHCYDNDSVPPCSRFWKNNEALINVDKPAANAIKNILTEVKNKLFTQIVGFIFITFFIVFNAGKCEHFLNMYIVPFVKNSPTLQKCVIIALVGCILTHLFNLVGGLLCLIGKKVLSWIRKNMR